MPRLVHLGLGAFARAHLCAYTAEAPDRWSVTGVGLLPADTAVRDAHPERGYNLVLAHPDGRRESRRIDVVDSYLYAPEDAAAVVAAMADVDTLIVSLTITEGGWAVPTELAPTTAIGMLVEALGERLDEGRPPFTVLSCDNLEHNGAVASRAVAGYADLVDPGLGAWVREQVAFPSSMVDRITPPPADPSVVVAEPWRQWVLEDAFPLGRPDWDALLVPDVRPYELMKLRLLNAGHQAIAYLGTLRGHTFAHEAMADPAVLDLLRRYWAEALPTLDPVPGVDLDAYLDALVERFGNPHVADTLARLRAYTSDRIPAFLLPVLTARLDAGLPVDACAEVLATWARYVEAMPELVVDNRPVADGEALLEQLGLLDGRVREPFVRCLAQVRSGRPG